MGASLRHIKPDDTSSGAAQRKRYVVAGEMTEDDAKALAKATRTGTVGPTTVYYAGLTAPVISASMSLVSKSAFEQTGLSNYWVFLLSALCAVIAGISWYMIFMRWSYRHLKSRADETREQTRIILDEEGITVKREHVSTHILWDGITRIKSIKSGAIITPAGASAIFVARRWFDGHPITFEQFERRVRANSDSVQDGAD